MGGGFGANMHRRRPQCGVRTVYDYALDRRRGVHLFVEFHTRRSEVTNYALVLALRVRGQLRTVRVYDGAHGVNELHRYTMQLGKRGAVVFHRGTLGDGMRTALEHIKHGHEEMIAGWRRG